MDFDPQNKIVRLCLQGMAFEEKGQDEEASEIFFQAWNEATDDLEKFLSAFYVARHQKTVPERLRWNAIALQFALKLNDASVEPAFSCLYLAIAKCYGELNNAEQAKENYELASKYSGKPSDKGPFYHGTKADLKIGDLLRAGGQSNYKSEFVMNHIYFTALVNGAGLAAALAKGEGRERVYIVEPTGNFENDPNVTNKKFPGNPTRSYRSTDPLKIIGEATDWVRQTPEQIKMWKEKLANNKGDIIN